MVKRVSASNVADVAFCPLRLKNQLSAVPQNAGAKKKTDYGDKLHAKQNRIGVDRRCFISSYVFGVDDPVTQDLRRFRDEILAPFFLGRVLIVSYYFCSPFLLVILKRSLFSTRLIKCSLLRLRSFLFS